MSEEELAKNHYKLFNSFLEQDLENLRSQLGTSNSRSSAREKLTRLSQHQFSELSTDVYDELSRRLSEDAPTFLQQNEQYHPKRNQARQKLATLQMTRFKELAGDVFFEIERRYPAAAIKTQPFLEPKPKAGNPPVNQNNKTSSLDPLPVSFASLDNLMADLGGMMENNKFDSGLSPQPNMVAESEKRITPQPLVAPDLSKYILKSDADIEKSVLQQQLQATQQQLKELEGKYGDLRDLSTKKINDVEAKCRKLEEMCKKKDQDYNALQDDYNEQQQITNDIRSEAANLLEEIKTLSDENMELNTWKEKVEKIVAQKDAKIAQMTKDLEIIKQKDSQISKLNIQLNEIKLMYDEESDRANSLEEKVRELQARLETNGSTRNLSPTKFVERKSVTRQRSNPNIDFFKDNLKDSEAFQKKRILPYSLAISELLTEAQRESPNTGVLVAMKAIVMACKSITEDCEKYEATANLTSQQRSKVSNCKSQLSTALTSQMLAAKAAATESSKEILEDLKSATGELTTVVIDLITTVNSYAEQLNSQNQPQTATPMNSQTKQVSSKELSDLKSFLEKQTDSIVQAIQSLLFILRQNGPIGQDFTNSVNGISRIVESLIQVISPTIQNANPTIQNEGNDILTRLDSATQSLYELGEKIKQNPTSKPLKQQIASGSYEIAKFVKQLISLVE
ncbi:hypothetical protein BC833DRAFT_622762 [Globomyces pollinis-pini]|nr:hypothetical protein BC833DRAFT_622762 [Globomyces pollinis-pini]